MKVHEFDNGDRNPYRHRYLAVRRSLAFSPDGKRLASIDRTWDLSSGKEVCQREGRHTGGLSYAPDGKAVATAGDDGAVRLHDPDTGKELPHLRGIGGSGEFLRLGFAPDGRRVVALRGVVRPGACEPGSARLQSWTADGQEARELVIDGCARLAMISPDGTVFVVAGDGGAVTVWDTVSGKVVRQLIGDDGKDKRGPGAPWPGPTFAFSADSRFVASTGRDGKDLRVWDVRTGVLVQTMKGQSEPVQFLTFSGNGRRLVSASFHDNHTARFWDIATGKEWRPAMALPGAVRAVSADGQTWAVAVEVRQRITDPLRICTVETGKELLLLEKGGRCAFAPDGRTIAVQIDPPPSTEEDDERGESTIQVIELATGGVRTQFRGHRAKLETLVYSPDAKLLASGSSDNTALLWDLVGHGDMRQGKVSATELQELWAKLGSEKAETAHVAMGVLARASEQTVAWIRTHLPPSLESEQVARLIRKLDDDDFAVREEADAALQRLADLAVPTLQKALKGKPSAEVRRRVTRLLEQLDQGKTPEQLRSLRAIELLERNGTPEARKVLEELAKGMPEALQTQEAKSCLDRLARRPR
jgi:WD40 repeat protein